MGPDEPLALGAGGLLDALWQELLPRWDDASAHANYLRAARECGRLADAARCYRGVMDDPERHEVAKAQLLAVTALALAGLETVRSTVPSKKRVGAYAALALGIFFVGVFLLLARAFYR